MYVATDNGSMKSEAFENYFLKTFISLFEGDSPVWVIYDGHLTHIDIHQVGTAVVAKIGIIKLPPYNSHLLQSLDLAAFKPIKLG